MKEENILSKRSQEENKEVCDNAALEHIKTTSEEENETNGKDESSYEVENILNESEEGSAYHN